MTSRMQRLARPVEAIWRLTTEAFTTAYAVVVLVIVEAAIRPVPLERLSRGMGCPLDLSRHPEGAPIAIRQELGRRARRELRCAHRVVDVWPGGDGPCLRRALVEGHLLRRLDTRLRLGTYDDGGRAVAHAWLLVGGRPLEDVTHYRHFDAVRSGGPVRSR